jgi:UDP-2,3-diacylglucosamine hydrolase
MAIRFISDLHLDASRPQVLRAFLHYLAYLPSDTEALYILGDFFEAWIGDDACSDFDTEVKKALYDKTDAGLAIYLMHGNRDFLIGQGFAADTGVKLLNDPYTLHYQGTDYLLMHGDSLCTDDSEYQAFRTEIRKPETLAFLMSKSIDERRAMAAQLRAQSKEANSNKAADIMDVNPDAVNAVMAEHSVTRLIHGHTHRPFIHHLDNDKQRVVLGDWDDKGWEVILDDKGVHLQAFLISEA